MLFRGGSFFTRNESLARSRANYRPLCNLLKTCMAGNAISKHLESPESAHLKVAAYELLNVYYFK